MTCVNTCACQCNQIGCGCREGRPIPTPRRPLPAYNGPKPPPIPKDTK